jgi:phage-related protein
MAYRLEFFNARVESEILGWPAGIAASFSAIAERMLEFGPDLGLPHTRALGAGLFEVRAKGREGIGRAFYCALLGQRIVILHGFIKKTQKTPEDDLKLARKRLSEVKHG